VLVGVQEVRWDKGGTERAEDCRPTLFYGEGTDHQLGTGFFTHTRILSAVRRVYFVSDRYSVVQHHEVVRFQRITYVYTVTRSRVSSGSIVSDYGLDDRAIGVRSPAGAEDFSSSLCPDQLWGPPSLLYNGYGVLSSGVKRGRGVMLTTQSHLVPRS
jgi:hypothetical protein